MKYISFWLIQNLHRIDLIEEMIRLLATIMEEAWRLEKIVVLSYGVFLKEFENQLVEKSYLACFPQTFNNFRFEYFREIFTEDSKLIMEIETILLTKRESNLGYFNNKKSELSIEVKRFVFVQV